MTDKELHGKHLEKLKKIGVEIFFPPDTEEFSTLEKIKDHIEKENDCEVIAWENPTIWKKYHVGWRPKTGQDILEEAQRNIRTCKICRKIRKHFFPQDSEEEKDIFICENCLNEFNAWYEEATKYSLNPIPRGAVFHYYIEIKGAKL